MTQNGFRLACELDRVARQIDAQMHRRLRDLRDSSVGPIGSLFLLHLADIQPCSIQALVDLMARGNSQMTRVIKGLEGEGLIERGPDPDDGRVSVLRLSAAGERAVSQIRQKLSEVVDEIVAPLSQEDRGALYELLRRTA